MRPLVSRICREVRGQGAGSQNLRGKLEEAVAAANPLVTKVAQLQRTNLRLTQRLARAARLSTYRCGWQLNRTFDPAGQRIQRAIDSGGWHAVSCHYDIRPLSPGLRILRRLEPMLYRGGSRPARRRLQQPRRGAISPQTSLPTGPRAARVFVSGVTSISASPIANGRVKRSTYSLPTTPRRRPWLTSTAAIGK